MENKFTEHSCDVCKKTVRRAGTPYGGPANWVEIEVNMHSARSKRPSHFYKMLVCSPQCVRVAASKMAGELIDTFSKPGPAPFGGVYPAELGNE